MQHANSCRTLIHFFTISTNVLFLSPMVGGRTNPDGSVMNHKNWATWSLLYPNSLLFYFYNDVSINQVHKLIKLHQLKHRSCMYVSQFKHKGKRLALLRFFWLIKSKFYDRNFKLQCLRWKVKILWQVIKLSQKSKKFEIKCENFEIRSQNSKIFLLVKFWNKISDYTFLR